MDIITLALAKGYTNIVGSTILGTEYDYNTGKLIFHTENGDWPVTVNNGMTIAYKNTLDNVAYDTIDNVLKVNGMDVLTKDDTEDENINFDGMFD